MSDIRILLAVFLVSSATLASACTAGNVAVEAEPCPGCANPPKRPRPAPGGRQVDGGPTNSERASDPDGDRPSVPDTSTPQSGDFSVGSVRCGKETCSGSTPVCCAAIDSSKCIANGASCNTIAYKAECDQAGDCPSDNVCCVETFSAKAHCVARSSCKGDFHSEACANDADCASELTCKPHDIFNGVRVCK